MGLVDTTYHLYGAVHTLRGPMLANAIARSVVGKSGPGPRAGTVIAALAATAVAGCSGGNAVTSEFQVRGANVVVQSAAPFTTRADFPQRVESTVDASLTYWGGSWSDLAGKTISFEDAEHVSCEGNPNAVGCSDGNEIRVSTRDVSSTFYCVEETVLVHEVGHAIIGDPGHEDPRWMDFTPVMQDLQGRPGYDGSGDVPCQIYVNVWRHPPAPAP